MVYTEEVLHPRRAPSRSREHQGQMVVTAPGRLERLETEQRGFIRQESDFGPFSVDLFASRTSAQFQVYCSFKPDPEAVAVDGLSITRFPRLLECLSSPPPPILLPPLLDIITNTRGQPHPLALQGWFPLAARRSYEAIGISEGVFQSSGNIGGG